MTAALVYGLVALLIVVLAVLWRLKPTTFKLTFKVWRLLHLEVESESRADTRS